MSQESRYCHKCGAPLAQGAAFCGSCGTPVAPVGAQTGPSVTPTPSAPSPPPWERRRERHEKQEKQEKREKQEKGEKGRGGELAGAITGGLVLVLLGILFYLAQAGLMHVTWGNFWEYFIIGLGAILIIQGLVRYAERGRAYYGSFIGGVILMLLGFAFVATSNYDIWPLILVVIGVAVIASAFVGRRRNPVP